MKEMKHDETRRIYSLIGVLGITVLALLMLVSIAGAAPFAYIPNSGDDNVSVLDTATNTVVTSISVGHHPDAVTVSPDGKKVYISNWLANSVSVIDTTTNKVIATVNMMSNPFGMDVSTDGKTLYVANQGASTVSAIDTTTYEIQHIDNMQTPRGVVVSPDGKNVYVTNFEGHGVSVINTTNYESYRILLSDSSFPFGIAISPDGNKIYVTNTGSPRCVYVIDTMTNSTIGTILLPGRYGSPFGITTSPDGARLYVANWDQVSIIDTATNTITDNIPTEGNNTFGISVTPNGKLVYVANCFNHTVSVIDTDNNSLISTIQVGGYPQAFGEFIGSSAEQNPILPMANFSTNVTSGYVPLSVQFNDFSKNATSAKWDFGDGSNSTERNPVHEFTIPGTYTVSLTASNENGTDSKSATITVLEQPVLPVANFSVNTTEGNAPLTVQFTDLSENSSSVKWDFGDGNNSTERNPVHEFITAGTYTVNLTASNKNGTDSKLATITVTEKPAPVLPVAIFSAKPTLGKAPLNVVFTDESTGAPISWKWTFGDGTNSTIQNPMHKYSKIGSYTVTLTATNIEGSNTTTKIDYIKVIEKPVAKFTSNVTSGKAPLTVAFTDKSKGIPTSWKWTFGDGAKSAVQNPIHQYSQEGKYKVTLTVTNAAGSSTTTKTNYIKVTTNTRPGIYSKSK